jgi:hypothetical protein
MSDQKVPTAPDYSPIINAYNAISTHATSRGDEAMAWAKDQVANNKDLINQINTGLKDIQSTFTAAGKDALTQGQGNVDDATGYLKSQRDRYRDPSYVANEQGAAQAQVGQAFDQARNASIQELESYGVNPSATRFAGLDASARLQRAAAQASAGTGAARNAESKADAANAALLNQGNTDVATGQSLTGAGVAAGQAGVQNNLAGTASGANVLGTDLAWTGARANALGGASATMNQQFKNQAEADKASNEASSGIGSALGLGASLASKFIGFEEGGAIPDQPGGAVDPSMSPSGGAATDDVAASAPGIPNIRLNGGEFVIPEDVASWLGEQAIQKMIVKARKDMGQDKQQAERPVGPAVTGEGSQAYASGGAVKPAMRQSDNVEDRRQWTPRANERGVPATHNGVPLPSPRPVADDGWGPMPARAATDLDRDAGAADLDVIYALRQHGARRVAQGAVGR